VRKFIYLFLLVQTIFHSCDEDAVPLSNLPSKAELNHKISATSSVSGLTNFKIANLAIPSTGLPDGTRFYSGGLLRSNVAYYPYSITKVTKNGLPRMRFYVKPTAPDSYLTQTSYSYHHRAEFTRYPWKISHPLGTEEWLGFSYIFPTKEEGFTQNQTPVSIYQNHAGRVGTQTENPPALQIEIAYPNQLRSSTYAHYNTPLGGEIMIINQVRGLRFVVPNVRVVPGARLNFIIQIIYGLGNEGKFNVWVNGVLATWPGNNTVPAGNSGSTVWPPKLSTDVPVGGNSKLGLYHHQLRYESAVLLNASKGHTNMQMFMTDWNDVIRNPSHWDYKNNNAYSAVDTSTYP
jgi:hypothetical protein